MVRKESLSFEKGLLLIHHSARTPKTHYIRFGEPRCGPPVSLRLGHTRALTAVQAVIHYPRAASLPAGEGFGNADSLPAGEGSESSTVGGGLEMQNAKFR